MKRGSKSWKTVSRKSNTKTGGKVTKIIHESTKEIKIERALVENFIALQKVMVNLSGKFDNLSGQISKLLELFEISAKSLAKRDFEDLGKENIATKRIMEKLDSLTQQAGLIGRGLALIHETGSERSMPSMAVNVPSKPATQFSQQQMQTQSNKPRPMPPTQSTQQPPAEEYRKSPFSRVSETNE
ncbi:hypothetical protein J4422_03710 [Candidatus Pacearchaeota archaeon]|nr:hypothetical protein [Candidatus Pacearchaeota archaeon]